jgi:DNA polymerase-3 subunit alpha
MSNWVPLHNHFEDSYLDGVLRFRDMDKIKAKGIDTIANTAHGNISGAYEFWKEGIKAGIKPIVGMEAYWAVDRKHRGEDDFGDKRPNYHMILLAQNKAGYQNLVKLSSYAYTDGFYYSPRIDNKLLEEYSGGLIATSACLGSRISQCILRGEKKAAKILIEYYADLFKDRFLLEVQCHKMKDQDIVNEVLLEFAKELNLPVVITSDSHYLECCDKEMHDKFLAIGTNQKLSDPKRFTFGDLECHLPDEDEIRQRLIDYHLPEEAMTNTRHVADMITTDYFENIINRYPTYKDLPEGWTSHDYLEFLSKTKYLEKNNYVKPGREVEDRIDHELRVIKKMGFSDYFLIRYDTVENGAKAQRILSGPGRGSAAGSYIAYLLGITSVDPIKYNLLFERMLNPGRAATPVIF